MHFEWKLLLFQPGLSLTSHCLDFYQSWENVQYLIFLSTVMGLVWSYDKSWVKLEALAFSFLLAKVGRCDSKVGSWHFSCVTKEDGLAEKSKGIKRECVY